MFAASPILLERAFRHTSLGAQWLVLAALYCYFVCRRQSRFASRGLFVINILAVGIHPYFLPMTYAVTLALFGKTPRMETRTSTSKKTDRGCMV